MRTYLVVMAVIMACAQGGYATPPGGYLTYIGEPVSASEINLDNLKKASGSTYAILGLLGFGDASTQTLSKNAGITRVAYVDKKTFSLFGFFVQETYTIYGE